MCTSDEINCWRSFEIDFLCHKKGTGCGYLRNEEILKRSLKPEYWLNLSKRVDFPIPADLCHQAELEPYLQSKLDELSAREPPRAIDVKRMVCYTGILGLHRFASLRGIWFSSSTFLPYNLMNWNILPKTVTHLAVMCCGADDHGCSSRLYDKAHIHSQERGRRIVEIVQAFPALTALRLFGFYFLDLSACIFNGNSLRTIWIRLASVTDASLHKIASCCPLLE
jgi:hypothetical protein